MDSGLGASERGKKTERSRGGPQYHKRDPCPRADREKIKYKKGRKRKNWGNWAKRDHQTAPGSGQGAGEVWAGKPKLFKLTF